MFSSLPASRKNYLTRLSSTIKQMLLTNMSTHIFPSNDIVGILTLNTQWKKRAMREKRNQIWKSHRWMIISFSIVIEQKKNETLCQCQSQRWKHWENFSMIVLERLIDFLVIHHYQVMQHRFEIRRKIFSFQVNQAGKDSSEKRKKFVWKIKIFF